MNNIDAIVVCGGRGRRMGHIMKSYRCKSLVPIAGLPALTYVLEALKHVSCSMCILSIDRSEIEDDIVRIGARSGLPFEIHMDSGRGPTSVVQEAASQVSSTRFLMLYGHQIVFPSHLQRMIATNSDFVATVYKSSSERVRKIATVNPSGRCTRLRRGSAESPAADNELYLDVPYILRTGTVIESKSPQLDFDPETPADAELRPHTILRYVPDLHTIMATFRHEHHYEKELEEVTQTAREFRNKFNI